MEQYPVPQFIEREAKIAFFISFRQFLYLIVAGVFCFIFYFILPFSLFIIATLILGGGALALGFLKIGGLPLTTVLWNSLGFLTGTKSYTWKKKEVLYPFKVIKKLKRKRFSILLRLLKNFQERKWKKKDLL